MIEVDDTTARNLAAQQFKKEKKKLFQAKMNQFEPFF